MSKENKQIMSKEEAIDNIKKRFEANYKFAFTPDPVYQFNIGDKVRVGCLKDATIYEKCDGGKYYIIDFTDEKRQGLNKIDIPHAKRAFNWYDVRPLEKTNESFIENENLRISFSTNLMRGLLMKALSFGVDMDPDYQRDLIWTDKDKEALIDSVFHNIDIGKFCFVELPYMNETSPSYQILDGKQRFTTLIDFYLNKFPYKGKFYNDLSIKDKNWFENYTVSVGELRESNKEQVLRHFIMLNTSGHVVDKEHIKKVEELLNKEIEKDIEKDEDEYCEER